MRAVETTTAASLNAGTAEELSPVFALDARGEGQFGGSLASVKSKVKQRPWQPVHSIWPGTVWIIPDSAEPIGQEDHICDAASKTIDAGGKCRGSHIVVIEIFDSFVDDLLIARDNKLDHMFKDLLLALRTILQIFHEGFCHVEGNHK